MQGAFRVLVAVALTAGIVPTASSAQVVDVPPVQVPPVSVPPVALPAPLPQVSTPQLSTPPVTLPGVRVDAPLPSVPSLPHVQAPPPPVPRPVAPASPVNAAAPPSSSGAPASASPTGPAPSTPAGTASASPARSRAAGVAALRGRRGVLGTSYRSQRRLVRALSACVAGLPARQERLIVMRYGLGAAASHPDGAVAGMLRLARGDYATLRRRALRGIVRDARDGGCRDGVAAAEGPAIAFGDAGEVRAASVAARGSRARIAVRGERASGGSASADDDGGAGLTTPLAADAPKPRGSLLGALMLVASLGLLALIGVRALRTRVRR